MRSLPLLAAAIATTLLGTGPTFAADGIGTLVSVTTQVSAGTKGAEKPMAQGASIYSDQVIVTDISGLGQIEFVDHTKLAIGPGSTLTLDKFIYDPAKGKTDIVMGFGQGAFRFITGAGSHQGYQISTPVATITVRGTAFDVAVAGDGEVAVAMIDGEVEVCSRRTLLCQAHNVIGKFLSLTPDGVFALKDTWDTAVLKGTDFAKAMPFMVNDNLLQPTFRAGQTVLTQYASAAGTALNVVTQAAGNAANTAGQVVNQAANTAGQAANNAGQTIGQAANTAGQAVNRAVQAPAQAIQNLPRVFQGLNPFNR